MYLINFMEHKQKLKWYFRISCWTDCLIYIESLSALLVKTPGDKLDKRVLPVSMRCWRHITHHSYGQGLFSQVSHWAEKSIGGWDVRKYIENFLMCFTCYKTSTLTRADVFKWETSHPLASAINTLDSKSHVNSCREHKWKGLRDFT